MPERGASVLGVGERGDVRRGKIVYRAESAFGDRDADEHRSHRLGHRERGEAVPIVPRVLARPGSWGRHGRRGAAARGEVGRRTADQRGEEGAESKATHRRRYLIAPRNAAGSIEGISVSPSPPPSTPRGWRGGGSSSALWPAAGVDGHRCRPHAEGLQSLTQAGGGRDDARGVRDPCMWSRCAHLSHHQAAVHACLGARAGTREVSPPA